MGKSRLLRHLYKEALFIDLLNEKVLLQFLSQPDRLDSMVRPLKKGSVVVIDEVQKAPSLLLKVHEILESPDFPKIQFILTGSSSRKLKKEGIDLLAGRAIVKNLFPFTAFEIGKKFSSTTALKNGLVPLVYSSTDPAETLSSYISTKSRILFTFFRSHVL